MAKNATLGEVVVYPAKGGLETISIPGTTTLGRLTDGFNFIIDVNGAKKKHPGTIRQDDQTQAIAPTGFAKGAFDFWRTNISLKQRRTTLIASGKIWADNDNGHYVDVTGPFSIIPSDNVSFETFFGLLVMAFDNNPTGVPLKFDQTTVSALGGFPPNAKYLRTWLNRLWATGDASAPDRLFASVPDNPEDWTVLNGAEQINIDQGDQDPVGNTALFPPLFGRMVVAKRRSLHEVVPVSFTFGVRPLTSGHGCISHQGVAAMDNDVIYPSDRGIHSLGMTDKFGEVETSYLSYPIHNFYQENVAFERAGNMRAIYDTETNNYLLALTTRASTSNDIVLGYNFNLNEWFKMEENVSAFSKYVDRNDGNKSKVILLDDRGRVGILDTTKSGRTVTWFGERRTMQFTTGIIYPVGVAREVTFRRLKMFFKPSVQNSKIDVSYLVNGTFVDDIEFPMEPLNIGSIIGSAIIGVDRIGGGGRIKHVTRELKGVGSAIELVVTHTPVADDDDCEIFGFIIEYEYSGETYQPKQQ